MYSFETRIQMFQEVYLKVPLRNLRNWSLASRFYAMKQLSLISSERSSKLFGPFSYNLSTAFEEK